MADFEDAHFDVFEKLGGLDGVEDVLEFAFETEDGQAGLRLHRARRWRRGF